MKQTIPTINILVGPPGSGKSTAAKEAARTFKDEVTVISRDELRKSMYGYTEENVNEYYEDNKPRLGQMEAVVTKEHDSLIRRAIRKGKNVIVDNTHCKMSYITYYTKFYAKLELTVMDTPYNECVSRDSKRTRVVGKEIIQKMYNDYENVKVKLPLIQQIIDEHNTMMDMTLNNTTEMTKPCIIFDIDGTLAHHTSRGPFDYSRVHTDTVDPELLHLNWTLSQTVNDIFIVSGRDSECEQETRNWLDANKIRYDRLIMRAKRDSRPDWIIKQEIWRDIINDGFHIQYMFDDRDQVVDRARQLGLKSLQVAPGDF